jgi:hypothetical protein
MYSLWAHGNALVVENPSDIDSISYRGWGAEVRVKAGASTWLHVPIPTALSADDEGAVLMTAHLDFIADGAGAVNTIVVYDGDLNVYESGPVGPGSTGATKPYRAQLPLPPLLAISGPVNLAINFIASGIVDSDEPPALFTVLGAGIDFEYVARRLEERDFAAIGERIPVAHG